MSFSEPPDPDTKDRHFAAAKATLAKAPLVCFLGFGFHETNVEALDLGTAGYQTESGVIMMAGSGVGMTAAECRRIEHFFPRCIRLFEDTKALEFLRTCPWLQGETEIPARVGWGRNAGSAGVKTPARAVKPVAPIA